MPTVENPITGLHAEVYAPTGGFIFGVSKFGDAFGINNAFVFGINKFGDAFGSSESSQWVDFIDDATAINYKRGAISSGAGNTAQVGAAAFTLRNAGNPVEDYRIRAGRKVRIRYLNETLFTGKIAKVAGRYIRKKTTYYKYFTIQTTDAIKTLAGLKAYGMGGVSEPYESFEDRIARILDTYEGVYELPTGDAYPQYRLCATVYEGSLASHLDLACNSVGAAWYIDKLGQVRFITALTDYVTAVFTDGTHTETVENPYYYYDINIDYDAANHINYLEIVNKDIIEDPENPGNAIAAETNTVYSDGASIKANDLLKETLETTLYNSGAYEGSINARAAEIIAATKDPNASIRRIFFNVQENFDATQLETLHRVELWLQSVKYNLRITGIDANINAASREWTIALDVVKEN